MSTTIQLLLSAFLRRHPAPEVLQACVDRELNDLESRIVRFHVRGCESCQEEMRSAQEVLEYLRLSDVSPVDVMDVRERIFAAMGTISGEQQEGIEEIRQLLGARGADRVLGGSPSPELENELAAFLGTRAAKSLLHRMAA